MKNSQQKLHPDHSVQLPSHPFRTTSEEAIKTLAAGVGKNSMLRRSSRSSMNLAAHFRSSTIVPSNAINFPNSFQSETDLNGIQENHSMHISSNNSSKTHNEIKNLAIQRSFWPRFMTCGQNLDLYDDGEKTMPKPLKQDKYISRTMKLSHGKEAKRPNLLSLSSRQSKSKLPKVEFDETPLQWNNQRVVAIDVPEEIEPELQPSTRISPYNTKNVSMKPPAVSFNENRNDLSETIPSSDAFAYTGRPQVSPKLQRPTERFDETISTKNTQSSNTPKKKNEVHLNLINLSMERRRNSGTSIQTYVSSSSLYSAASADDRTTTNINTPVANRFDTPQSTPNGQSPFMVELLSRFPTLPKVNQKSNDEFTSTLNRYQDPSLPFQSSPHQLRNVQNFEQDTADPNSRAPTPHPPGFMPVSENEEELQERETYDSNSIDQDVINRSWHSDPLETPPPRLQRKDQKTRFSMISPSSSLSNSTLQTPSPPLHISEQDQKRRPILGGNFATQLALSDLVKDEEQGNNWQDRLIEMYSAIPSPNKNLRGDRESILSSTNDSFHSTKVFEEANTTIKTEGEEDFSLTEMDRILYSHFTEQNNEKPSFDASRFPPPSLPLPPLPLLSTPHFQMRPRAHSSTSQHTIGSSKNNNKRRMGE